MSKSRIKIMFSASLAVLLGWFGTSLLFKASTEVLALKSVPRTLLYQSAAASGNEVAPIHRYYLPKDAPPAPSIKADSFLIADLLTGNILLEKDGETAYPIASLSKLITASVALEQHLASTTLLYPLLLQSSNVSADKIADSFGHDTFMQWMNDFAKNLGMTHTHYDDPSGISPKNVSSAEDLLILARHLYTKQPEILSMTLLPTKDKWVNNNMFVLKHTDYYIGGKSGYTPEAGGTLVAFFDLPLSNGQIRPIVVILLGTDDARGAKYELAGSLTRYLAQYVSYK